MRTELDYLTSVRRHVLGILDGLDDDALRRPVLPSGWSCLGLVRHLTHDVEIFWFQAVVGGRPDALEEGVDSWAVEDGVAPGNVLAAYRDAAGRSDAIVAGADPDAPPGWWPEGLFGDWRLENVREIVQHVIVETATHAGHLDAVRELVDGRQWMVLT